MGADRPFAVALRGQRKECQGPNVPARLLLVGDFAEDAAGDLDELGHVVAQILGLLVGVLQELLEQLQKTARAR